MELFAEQPKELESESPHLFRAHRRLIRDPLEAYRSADGHEQLQAREDAVQKVLDRNGAYSEEEGYSGSEQARWNCRAYLAIMNVFLLTGVGVGLCFEVWIRQSARKSDADVLLPQHVKDTLRDVADQRRDEDDKTFWGRVAVEAEQGKYTLADVIYFMQYAKQCYPLTEPFFWDSPAQQDAVSAGLEERYKDAGGGGTGMAAVFRALPDITHDGVPMLRYVQAACAQLAFGCLADQVPMA